MILIALTLYALAVAPNARSICLRQPIAPLPQPCSIRNLTIVSSNTGKILANGTACNTTVTTSQLASQPKVNITYLNLKQYMHSKFLLLAFDATLNQLLWVVSNISIQNTILVPTQYSRATISKPYEAITVPTSNKYHEVIFLVFEERPNFVNASVVVTQSDVKSFQMISWLSRQIFYGVRLCGPVAATRLAVFHSLPTIFQTPSAPYHFSNFPIVPIPPISSNPQEYPDHSKTSYNQSQKVPYFNPPQNSPHSPPYTQPSHLQPQPTSPNFNFSHSQPLYPKLPPYTGPHFQSHPLIHSYSNNDTDKKQNKNNKRNAAVNNFLANLPMVTFFAVASEMLIYTQIL